MLKCIHDSAPKYLTELIVIDQVHDHNLRSTDSDRIHTMVSRTKMVHESSFCSMGPRIWTNLPETVIKTTSFSTFIRLLPLFVYIINKTGTAKTK